MNKIDRELWDSEVWRWARAGNLMLQLDPREQVTRGYLEWAVRVMPGGEIPDPLRDRESFYVAWLAWRGALEARDRLERISLDQTLAEINGLPTA